VKGLSQLYRDSDTFIAGSSEQGFKRNLSNPSSLSSNGHSASPQQRQRVQKSRKKPREEPSGMFGSELFSACSESILSFCICYSSTCSFGCNRLMLSTEIMIDHRSYTLNLAVEKLSLKKIQA